MLRRALRPRPRASSLPSAALAAALLVPVGLLAGCSGDQGAGSNSEADADDDGEATPEEVLALAKTTLDDTSGVQLSLTTDNLPDGTTGITSATGVATAAPAFEGEIAVSLAGNSVEVPVVAVGGEVFAELPLVPGFQTIDPGEYGAPDPAELIDPELGVSTLLTATEEPTEGETVRGGADNSEVLTEYSGTVTDDVMTNVIPSAEGDFDVVYTITEDGELRSAELTGVFYPSSAEMTYTVDLTDYGTEQDITAP
ncbi:hypothetical protein ENKNEFLB_03105 [Nocardioides aquaticus]|uniref:LppX_LprAFG lipoprotein n=1 Tax=Nocardioides aquaticus TaxID=160826 RepID=A0ABX8ELJ9_9ACTN|nr:LppX_LprAFG lipoprotein [Nocardioides aquaticus]QVT80705.1 hypothetical protein ENKNEFLB_03105 [Nocardioides aquaticus]